MKPTPFLKTRNGAVNMTLRQLNGGNRTGTAMGDGLERKNNANRLMKRHSVSVKQRNAAGMNRKNLLSARDAVRQYRL